MRPPDLPGGNQVERNVTVGVGVRASMRPPDLPGGNKSEAWRPDVSATEASMRPPDLPGGNDRPGQRAGERDSRFNEAAGFTRRKRRCRRRSTYAPGHRFNEAAGFTRRKPGRARLANRDGRHASMRPPDLPGGNVTPVAAFIGQLHASMRPPDLPGGNARAHPSKARGRSVLQ